MPPLTDARGILLYAQDLAFHAHQLTPDAERAAIGAAADIAVATPGGLADVQAHIAALEARNQPVPGHDALDGQLPGDAPAGSGDPAVDAAQEGVDRVERRASAIQQAAAYLMRSGI